MYDAQQSSPTAIACEQAELFGATPGPDEPDTPVLSETFVETSRFTGAIYKASGWINAETTERRGRYDRHMKRAPPRKDIWLQPLRKDWRRTLNR